MRRLTDFGRGIRHVWNEPYEEIEGRLKGPPWIVEVIVAQWELEVGLEEYDLDSVYHLAVEFTDVCNIQLYVVDRSLRETAGDLVALSNGILGSLKR